MPLPFFAKIVNMSTTTSKKPDLPSVKAIAKNSPQSYQAPRKYAWTLVITSAIAFTATFILVLERLELYKNPAHTASCDIGGPFSCTSVMETPQATLFGFPNPLIGVACFAVTGTIGVILLTGARLPRWFFTAMLGGVTAAMFLVGWFWFQAIYVIGMLCLYCMIVWVMVIPMFWKTVRFAVSQGLIPSGPRVKKIFTEWISLVILLSYLTVIFTTAFAFAGMWATMLRG